MCGLTHTKKIQITGIRNESVTTDHMNIEKEVKNMNNSMFSCFDSLDEMDQFLKSHKVPKHTQEKLALYLF